MGWNLKSTFLTGVQKLRLWPLSLAEKCRLMFGAAVLLTLALVLLFPYAWMRKLTYKNLTDICRERAHTLYRTHFQADALKHASLPALNAAGEALDPNRLSIQWVRFDQGAESVDNLPEPFQGLAAPLLEDIEIGESIAWEKTDGVLACSYVKLFRANERCMACHHAEGSAQPLSLSEPVGLAMVSFRDRAGETDKLMLINWVASLVAGLIGAMGAMIAFYWITQRVILRPIRQLRALANNVADGNLNVRSTIQTGDEYERLAEAFNHMLDTLGGAQDKLQDANRQLDIKIVELSERNIELYKANKIKSEFLANMSHEFRTPLNAILGFAQVLRDKPAMLKRDKGQRYAENILSSGNRLLHMINDLLQLAKAEAGRLELRVEKGSISQILETLVSSFSLQTEEKRIRVHLTVDPAVPVLATDIGKVQQILYNLFSNAVKFTPEKGRIDLDACMVDEKTVKVSVRDNGCGISKADQETIFEKFRQVDGSITRQSPGTGLGLAISKELADMLAGSIGLESTPGEGSVFWLQLPVQLESGQEGRPGDATP
jgi:signal transduction histidine kinase